MGSSIEYSPFDYAEMQTNETQRIIEKTRLGALGEPIVKEVIQISNTSIILKPVNK